MDDLPGRQFYEVATPQQLHDLMARFDRGEEALPAVSSRCSLRYPADQGEELAQQYRSLIGASDSADVRLSRFSEESRLKRRPSKRGRRAMSIVLHLGPNQAGTTSMQTHLGELLGEPAADGYRYSAPEGHGT